MPHKAPKFVLRKIKSGAKMKDIPAEFSWFCCGCGRHQQLILWCVSTINSSRNYKIIGTRKNKTKKKTYELWTQRRQQHLHAHCSHPRPDHHNTCHYVTEALAMQTKAAASIEEQLALYRQRKKAEESRWTKSKVWELVMSVFKSGASSDSENSDVKEDASIEETPQKVRRRTGAVLKPGGQSTDSSDSDQFFPQSSSIRSYTTLDWVALALKCMMWLVLCKVFIILEFGAVFFIISAFVFMWYNLRNEPKKEGELSAYSIFNPDCQKIDGTFTAEQFERELLHKM